MASIIDRTVDMPRHEILPLVRRPGVLAVALAVVGILIVHAETAASMVAIWWRSETFAHGFVIVPITIWLVWQRRAALLPIQPRPWYPGIAAVLASGGLWTIATLADVQAARQFALVFMLGAAILAVIGLRAARKITFPLVFLLFAVPFGEFMIPTMIDRTADFTVAALRASGVPVYREANHFIIPSGAWSVVEACSGIRYLIVSVVVGTVYAMVSYRSPHLRAAFIGLSIVVPLVANWLRAYGIVMLGHLSGNRLAVGVDHLIYGWLFFGVVMALLFWLGSFWQERPAVAVAAPPVPTPTIASTPKRNLFTAAVLAILAAAIWQPLPAWLDRAVRTDSVALAPLPGVGGWLPTAAPVTKWKPRFSGFQAELQQQFAANGESAVDVYIAFYRNQSEGRELVSSSQALVANSDWNWKQVQRTRDALEWDGRSVEAERSVIAGDALRLIAYRLYWINGRVTSSDAAAKLALAWSRLRGRGDDSALLVFSAPANANDETTRASLRRFVATMSPAIEHALEAAGRGSP